MLPWVALASALLAGPFVSPARAQFKTLETEDLKLVYLAPWQSYLSPYAARCFTNSMRFQRTFFHYEPFEPVTMTLLDLADYANAGATAVPRNLLTVDISPANFAYETYPSNERIHTFMNHEMVHVMAMDSAGRSDRFFRGVFGGKVNQIDDHPETILYSYLTNPRRAAPRWYQEGMAVFFETWMAGGIGRAQGSYDEMVFRAKVADQTRIDNPLGLVAEGTMTDFQVGALHYLYGTRFVSYLAHRFGPQSLVDWVVRGDGTKGYYASQFKMVYERPLDDVWDDWIAFEREFQAANLEQIRQYPITPHEDLSLQALGSISRAFLDPDGNSLYVAFAYPGVVSHLGAIDLRDGTVRRIQEVKGPMLYAVTSLAFDPVGKTLFYTADNNRFRDLHAVPAAGGESRRLIRDARIGEIVFNPADRSLLGIRHYNGIATLVRIPEPWTEWHQIHSFPYGTTVYDLDISHDGKQVAASIGEVSGKHSLGVYRLDEVLAGTIAPIATHDFGTTIPSNFVFSADDRYLYGSSYYTGVSNIFRFEPATGAMEAVTNTETGFFRPIHVSGDTLIVFRYTGEGFIPARIASATPLQDVAPITFLGERIAEEHPEVTRWAVPPPSTIDLEPLILRERNYSRLRELRLESIYPVIEGYKDFNAFGFHAVFSDPLQLNTASITASWTPDNDLPSGEQMHVKLEYDRHDWRFLYKYNGADFYDLFGPTRRSRKGYTAGVGWKKALIYDVPRRLDIDVWAAHHQNIDTLPRAQNVEATVDEISEAAVRLDYANTRKSLGAVDEEKGVRSENYAGGVYVENDLIPAVLTNLDLGFPLPLAHSSIWFRNWAGAAFGDPNDPFANFYFGGFGNNRVDNRSIKRYRDHYSFPGFEINEIGGRNFFRTMLELNLPPLRFRHLGTPGFYGTWARAAVFASGLRTNLDDASLKRDAASFGTQVDFRFTLLSRLPMTLSFGYAVGSEKDGERNGEFLYSLKILGEE